MEQEPTVVQDDIAGELPAELQAPPTAVPADVLEGRSPRTTSTVLKAVGILGTGLVAGVIGVVLIQGPQGTSNAADTTQNGPQGGLPGTQNGIVPGQNQGGFGGRGGGIAGETRLVGTISSVGSASITVKATDGTSTKVPVNGTTEIVRNGATSSLSALRSGDQVLVHVVPSGSSTVAERIFAGTSATQGPGGFGGPPPDQQGQNGSGPTSTT